MTFYDEASIISFTLILGSSETASPAANVPSLFFIGSEATHPIVGLRK